jgi:hypothetical protein
LLATGFKLFGGSCARGVGAPREKATAIHVDATLDQAIRDMPQSEKFLC